MLLQAELARELRHLHVVGQRERRPSEEGGEHDRVEPLGNDHVAARDDPDDVLMGRRAVVDERQVTETLNDGRINNYSVMFNYTAYNLP